MNNYVGTHKENHKACMNVCRTHIHYYLRTNVLDIHNNFNKIQKVKDVTNSFGYLITKLEKTRMLDYHVDLNDIKYGDDGDCFHDFLQLIESSNGLFVDKYEVMRNLNFIAHDYRLIANLCYIKNTHDENVFVHCQGDDFKYFIFEENTHVSP